jgi:hypothetical protein
MVTRVISLILIGSLLLIFSAGNWGCANMVPPVGGPKDSIPPQLVKAIPANGSLSVKTKTIVFNFDEFVELEDQNNRIQVSPLPVIQPEITRKLKTVTIKLKDSLLENTTYSIQINGAIKDVNEGNKLNDLVYIFSTGTGIDSNSLQGKVIMAETGQIDSTLIVVLHNSETDSAVLKEKPQYYTTLNSKGEFYFQYLPPKQFSIYTIKDEGNQKKYLTESQLFGFYNNRVNAAKNESGITLYAYVEKEAAPRATTERVASPNEKLKIGTNLAGNQMDMLKDLVLTFNKKINAVDLNQIELTDTLYQRKKIISSVFDSAKKTITIKTNWQPEAAYRLLLPNTFSKDEKGVFLTRSDTLRFVTKKAKDYGNVVIRFNKLDLTANPVLQIVQNGVLQNSYPLNAFKLTIPVYNPGEYDLRLLTDTNKNGIWDTGNFFTQKKQPEKVITLPKKLVVKADWDNELEID